MTDLKLGHVLVDRMSEITSTKVQEKGLKNAEQNLPEILKGKSIKGLKQQIFKDSDSALVIAAGPSIKKQHSERDICFSAFQGMVIATESAMLYCLRRGIIPDLVVSVDPIRLIIRWFGDPELRAEHIQPDDYISRQDLDESFHDQIKVNQEILSLVDHYGPKIKIALSSSVSPIVVKRAIAAGMDIYWWNPMYDEPTLTDGITRELYNTNGLPCMNAGGNVGSASWMFADVVFNKTNIGLMGMDFGYYADLPYRNTQYYEHAVNLFGEDNLDDFFIKIFNTDLDAWFYTDPTYMWYRSCLLEMIENTESNTFNCTEGGIIFGDHIESVPLNEFLQRNFD